MIKKFTQLSSLGQCVVWLVIVLLPVLHGGLWSARLVLASGLFLLLETEMTVGLGMTNLCAFILEEA